MQQSNTETGATLKCKLYRARMEANAAITGHSVPVTVGWRWLQQLQAKCWGSL